MSNANAVEKAIDILRSREEEVAKAVISEISTHDGEQGEVDMTRVVRNSVLFKRETGSTGAVGAESNLRENGFFVNYKPLVGILGKSKQEAAFKYLSVASFIAGEIHAKNITSTFTDFAGIGIAPSLDIAQSKEESQIYYSLLNSIGNQVHAFAAAAIKLSLERTMREYSDLIKSTDEIENLPSPAQFQEDVFKKLYKDFGFNSVAAIPFGRKDQREMKEEFASLYLGESSYINANHLSPNGGDYVDENGKKWLPYNEGNFTNPILYNDNISKDKEITLYDPQNPIEKKIITAKEHPLYRGHMYDKIVESSPVMAEEMERYGILPSVVNRIFAVQLSKKFIRGLQKNLDHIYREGFGVVVANSFSDKASKNFYRESYSTLEYAGKKTKNFLGRDRQLSEDLDDTLAAVKKMYKAGVITDGDGRTILQNGRRSVSGNYHHIGIESEYDIDNEEITERYGLRNLTVGKAALTKTGDGDSAPKSKKEVAKFIVSSLDSLATSMGIPMEDVGMGLSLSFAADANQNAEAHYTPAFEQISLTRGKLGALGHEWFHAFDDKVFKQAQKDGVIDTEDLKFVRKYHELENYTGRPMMISSMYAAITTPNHPELTEADKIQAAKLKEKLQEYNPEMFEIARLYAGEKHVELDDGQRITMNDAAQWYASKQDGLSRIDADVSFHRSVLESLYLISQVRSYVGYIERNDGDLPPHLNSPDGKINTALANGIREILLHSGDSEIVKRMEENQLFITAAEDNSTFPVATNPIEVLKAAGVHEHSIAEAMTSGMRNLTAIFETEGCIKEMHQQYIKTFQVNRENNAQREAEVLANIQGQDRERMIEKAKVATNDLFEKVPSEIQDRDFAINAIGNAIVTSARMLSSAVANRNLRKQNERDNEDNIQENFIDVLSTQTGLNPQSSILLKMAENLGNQNSVYSQSLVMAKFIQQNPELVEEIAPQAQFLSNNQTAIHEFVEIAQRFDAESDSVYMSNPSELFARTGEAVLGEKLNQLGLINSNLTSVNLLRESTDLGMRTITYLSYPSEAATKVLTSLCEKMISRELGYQDYQLDPAKYVEYHGNTTGSEVVTEYRNRQNSNQLSLFDDFEAQPAFELPTIAIPPKQGIENKAEQELQTPQNAAKTTSFDM